MTDDEVEAVAREIWRYVLGSSGGLADIKDPPEWSEDAARAAIAALDRMREQQDEAIRNHFWNAYEATTAEQKAELQRIFDIYKKLKRDHSETETSNG